MDINIDNALNIEGWMNPEGLAWLAKQARIHMAILEIGAWKGRSTRALADNIITGVITTVDTWEGITESESQDAGKVLEEFQRNIEGVPAILIPWQAKSSVAMQALINTKAQFDMIFLDGSHTYEDIYKDIELALQLITENGLLCGHDITHPGVYGAVCDLIGKDNFGTVEGDSIWYRT